MYLAYCLIAESGTSSLRLCMVPDKPDEISIPIPVDRFINCEAAICRVGLGDSCTIKWLEEEQSFLIKSVSPSRMYLTPELPTKPGVWVTRIKVKKQGASYTTLYGQERDEADQWKEWKPTEIANL